MAPAAVRHIFISCGEASGDRYGAALTAALRSIDPDVRITALGGRALDAAGAEIVQDAGDLAVMGFSEVIGALPAIVKARRRIWRFLESERPDLVVPLDFPGFNTRVAGKARKLGVPVFWLIAPQIWAWGAWRLGGFRKRIDRLGTVLPFEEEFFRQRGFSVFPMGHPLMDDYGGDYPFRQAQRRREKVLNSRETPITVGILPGSRRQELDKLLPILRVASQAIVGHLGEREVRFVVSAAPGVAPSRISSVFETRTEVSQLELPRLLESIDLALVCSGTATLEAALAGVPHELVYRTGALNYLLGKRLVKSPYIGLSNLILGRQTVVEHVQDHASPLPLARALLRWVARPSERQRFYGDAMRLRELCGAPGIWERTARTLLAYPDTRAEAAARGGEA